MTMKKNKGNHMNALDPSRKQRFEDVCARIEKLGLASPSPGVPRKAVIVNGTRYENATEAALAIGVSEGTIRDVARGDHISPLFTACWA